VFSPQGVGNEEFLSLNNNNITRRRSSSSRERGEGGPGLHLGLYTILSLTVLHGIHYNKEGSRGTHILRNSVCGEGGKWGAQAKVVFAENIIDSCTYASA